MTDDAYENLKLDRQLCFLLYACSKAMVQAYKPYLGQFGITYPQYLVLLVLWEQDDISLKHLGERLHLDSGTLTPLLKRLQSQGLVSRDRSKEDEREIRILLTSEGQTLKEKVKDLPTQMACELDLDDSMILAMKKQLHTFLSKIKEPRNQEP